MHHLSRLCATAALVLSLTGCASLYSGYSVKPIGKTTVEPYVELVRTLQQAGSGESALIDKACFASTFAGGKTNDAVTCTAQRNQAVSALVFGSDMLCMAHRRSMYGNEAVWNITLGTVTNLFAGAASVVSQERAKSVLAALTLFSNSERSLLNETVYKQMLVTAVDKKIVETREAKMLTLYTTLKQTTIAEYSMHEALRDLLVLHNSCSFIEGLEKALQEGTQDTPAAKIARLRATLLLLTTERTKLVLSDATKEQAQGLDARIKATSAALQAEEVR